MMQHFFNRVRMALAVVGLALCVGHPALAANYYFSSSGSAGNNGTTPTTPKQALATMKSLFGSCAAGDSYLLAAGSTYSITSNELNYMDCRNGTKSQPVTIGMYVPAAYAYCTGSGGGGTVTYNASGTMTDTSKSGTWTLNQFAGCEIKVNSRNGPANTYQRMVIASNTTTGVITLANRRDAMGRQSTKWLWTPKAGESYTIEAPMPVLDFTNSTSGDGFSFADSGNSAQHNWIVLKDLRLQGTMFMRKVTSASGAVITDSTLGSETGYATNELAGRKLIIKLGTCASDSTVYTVASNTATTITLTASLSCVPDSTSRYRIQNNAVGPLITFLYKNNDYLIDGVSLQGAEQGIYCTTSNAGSEARMTLRNIQVFGNAIGLLGGCGGLVGEKMLFAENGSDFRDHAIYLGGETTNTWIRWSFIYNSFMGDPVDCNAVAVVIHGKKSNYNFTDNVVSNDADPTDPGCWGMSIDSGYSSQEGFTGVTIEGNYVSRFYIGIGVDQCNKCLVRNNNVYQNRGQAIKGRSKDFQVEDVYGVGNTKMKDVAVQWNSIYIAVGDASSFGIQFSRNAGDSASQGGLRNEGNLVYMGASTTSGSACFGMKNLVVANFASWDYNQCYIAGAAVWASTYSTLTAAKAAGIDTNSIQSNPTFTVGPAPLYALTVTNASTAYDSGSPTATNPFAIGGLKRVSKTKGAYDPDATTVVPGAATNVR